MATKMSRKAAGSADLFAKAADRAFESGPGTELEDGIYKMALKSAKIGESQTSGRRQVNWTWVVTDGDDAGATKIDTAGIQNEDNIYYLNLMLMRFGYEPPRSEQELAEILEELTENHVLCRCRLTTKKDSDFQNLRVLKVLQETYELPDDDNVSTEEEEEEDSEEVEEDEEEEGEEEGGPSEEEIRKADKPGLQEICDTYDLEIKDADKKTLTSFRAAVVEALYGEEEDEEDEEEETEEEVEEEEVEEEPVIDKGDSVTFKLKGKEVKGKVKEVDAENEKAKVSAAGKVYSVNLASLSLVE